MPTTRGSRGSGTSAGKRNGTKQTAPPKQPASSGSSTGMSPAQKRKATIERQRAEAEEARRAAAGDDLGEENGRESVVEQDELGGDADDVAQLREKVRKLEEHLKKRSELDQRRARLAEEETSVARRRDELLNWERVRDAVPRGLNTDRADNTSRGTPNSRSVAPSAAEDVSITGVSRVASSLGLSDATADHAAIATAAAEFVRNRFAFAASSVPYGSYPSSDISLRGFEDRLTGFIRQALQDDNPNPASLGFALGETAQAARCLIPGLGGERVSALLHGQVLQLGNALAGIASKMGDAADVAALTRMIVREVFRQLQTDGSDPAAFVRKRLDELRIAADMRLVKHSFAPAAAAHRSQALPGVSLPPVVPPPPGLGYSVGLKQDVAYLAT